jgi:hypothetical protein
MKARTLGFILLVSLIAPMAHGALEFSGYISTGSELRFIVTNLDSRRTSEWLMIGDTFEGHSIAGFDLKEEVLVVHHAGTPVRLSLKGARVRDAKQLTSKVDDLIVEIIALRFDGDRSKFLSYLRSRRITSREYRREVEATVLRASASGSDAPQSPNKAPEPTTTAVTPPAAQESRQP